MLSAISALAGSVIGGLTTGYHDLAHPAVRKLGRA